MNGLFSNFHRVHLVSPRTITTVKRFTTHQFNFKISEKPLKFRYKNSMLRIFGNFTYEWKPSRNYYVLAAGKNFIPQGSACTAINLLSHVSKKLE